MLFQAARPTVGEEESTRATYVTQLHNNKKHTCNAKTQQNTESTDQDYLKTSKTHVPSTQHKYKYTHSCYSNTPRYQIDGM